MLEKFIQYCHSKHEGLSDYYITQTYNNMQELLYVQFLEAELQNRINHVMSLFGCQLVVNPNDIIEALTGDIDQSLCDDEVCHESV